MRIIRVRKYGKHHSYIIPNAKIYVLSGIIFGLMSFWSWLNTPPPEWHSPKGSPAKAYAKMITPAPTPTPTPPQISRRLEQHIKARPDTWAAILDYYKDDAYIAGELIARESGFNEFAINPTSGACGLAQALPCSKMKCELSDVYCQLIWINNYVERRYGDFYKAVKFHDQNNWY